MTDSIVFTLPADKPKRARDGKGRFIPVTALAAAAIEADLPEKVDPRARVIDLTDNTIVRDMNIKEIAKRRLRRGDDVHSVFAFIAQQCRADFPAYRLPADA